MPKKTFACARQGLREALQFGLLGGYDGAASWTLATKNTRSSAEQRMVEVHEGLHHELQISSGWGLVSGMAWLLSCRGRRPSALGELFHVMVDESRQTHEVFATALSATMEGTQHARDLLAGNPSYLQYLSRGLALVDSVDAGLWQFHHAAMASVLRVCMRPAAVLDLLDVGFLDLRRDGLNLDRDSPDRRLATFERAGGPSSWGPVFRELLEEHPHRGGDDSNGPSRRLPEAPEALDRLRRFEEEVLLPRLHAHVCAVLNSAGMPSISSREQSRLARALKAAVADSDPELAGELLLATERRPFVEEAFDFSRQQVRLRERLPVDLVDSGLTLGQAATFSTDDGDRQRHVCALWIDREVARKQFRFPAAAGLPELVIALATTVDDVAGHRSVRIGLLPAGTTPQECQHALGDIPLVLITTHLTLARHSEALAALQAVEPVFVLMDLPIGRHVGHWISQGATVQVVTSPVERSDGVALALAVFAISPSHPLVFVCIGGETSTYVLADQIRQRHPGHVDTEASIDPDRWIAMDLAVSYVLNTWHVLDQQGSN